MNELVQSWITPPLDGWKCRCGLPLDFPGLCDSCAKIRERRIAKDLIMERIATIPERFRWATFGDASMSHRCSQGAIAAAEKAAPLLQNRQNIVLIGPAGAGKTSLACAVLRSALEKPIGVSGRFCSVVELARARSDSAFGHTPSSILTAIQASVIVLDDVGQEPTRTSDVITEVVHSRHNSESPTIITTFLSPHELADRYGDGTARRMLEHTVIIQLGGENA